MNKYAALILLLAALACGRDNQARIVELLAQFKQDAARHGVAVDLRTTSARLVDSFHDGRVGQCNLDTRGVELLRRWWVRASNACQEQLLYHELGHCILDRTHLSGYQGPQGFPTSIMRRSVFNCDVYMHYRAYYLRELFRFKE